MSWSDALPIVLEVKKIDEKLTSLKAEIESLKQELQLWKAGKEFPEAGKYYTAAFELLQIHGWEFFGPTVALRCDGTRWRTMTRENGTTSAYFEHVFTAPHKYDNDDTFGRTGWIKMGFETHELHQTSPVVWEDFHWIKYLDHNDNLAEWGATEDAEE
jgi:hypothetical protein